MLKQKSKTPIFISRALLLITSLAVLSVGITSFISQRQTALAATNGTINFQARLLTAAGNVVPDGVYNVEFKLYNALSSSGSSQGSCTSDAACKWVETRTDANKVTVKNGYLTVNLGSVTAFGNGINWDQDLWLTMNIGGTGSPAWDGEMNPRLKLTAVPYAFRSGAVVSADGTGVLTAANGESGTICVQNSVNCGFVQGEVTDFIQNTVTPQTANISITSALADSAAISIQGADNASVPVAVIKGGAAPGSAADLLQLQDSTGAAKFKVDNDGDATLARSLKIDYVSGVTNQLNIQGPGGSQFVTVNSANNKFFIGDQDDCGGRFCVAQNLSGTGGASYTNTLNSSITSFTSPSTIINQDIYIKDTSTALNNLIRGIRVDSSATTNTEATLNSFQILIPTTTSASTFAGNAIQVQNGSTNIFRITNTGQATFQSTNDTNTAFRIMNSGGSAMFTLNTNGTNDGIYISGTSGNAGGRIFFGSTSDSGVWIGEDGTTDTNVLSLNSTSGLKILVAGQNVADFSSTGALNLRNTSDSTQAFSIKDADGDNLLTVDTQNSRVGINLGANNTPSLASSGLEIKGGLRLSGGTTDVFTTPIGANVGTKINIPLFDPGAFGQILALGLGASAQDTARGISLFDARTTSHQPTLAVFNPNENDAFGLSWDGSNTTAYLKSLSGQIGIRPGGSDAAIFSSTGIDLLQNTSVASGKAFTVLGTLRASTIDASVSGQNIDIGGTNALGINLNESTSITGSTTGNTLTVSNSISTGNIVVFRDDTTDVATIADGGAVTFQNSGNSNSAFRVLNAAGSAALFTVNTSSTDTGIYIAGTGTGGGSSRVFFGPTGDTGVWIGEDGTTNTNILALSATSGLKMLIGGSTVASASSTGAFTFMNSTDSGQAFNVKSTNGNSVLMIDTANGRVGVGLGAASAPALATNVAGLEVNGAVRISGSGSTTNYDDFTTPLSGAGFVQTVGTASSKTSGTTLAITVPSGGIPADHTLIARVVHDYTSGAPTMADSRGNTYTRDRSAANSTIIRGSIFSARITTALQAGDTITLTLSSSVAARAIAIDEFTNVLLPITIDAQNGLTGTSTSPALPITTTNANDFIVGMVGVEGAAGETYAEDTARSWSGLARVGTTGSTADTNVTINGAYRSVSSTGTYIYGPTLGTSANWVEFLMAYRATTTANTVKTRMSIVADDPGQYYQLMTLGLKSTANLQSRALSLFDARTSAHDPTLAVFSPDESRMLGFNWNGSNSQGYIQTNSYTAGGNSAGIVLQSGSVSGGNGSSGNVTVSSGSIAGGAAGYQTGTVTITSGDASSTDGSSGNVVIDSGAKNGSGVAGTIRIGTANAPQIYMGNTSGATAIDINSGTGGTTFKSTDGTTAFRILNAAGTTALFTVNTSSTDTGIYIAGTGTSGGGGRVFFGPTGDTGAWIGEEGTTSTNVLALNGNSGLKMLVNGTAVGTVSSDGAFAFQNSTDSNFAFTIKSQANAGIMRVDSTNRKIAIGNYSGDAGDNIGAQLEILPVHDSRAALSIKGYSSAYIARYIDIKNSDGGNIFNVTATGDIMTASGVLGTELQNGASSNSMSVISGNVTGSSVSADSGIVTIRSGHNTAGATGAITIMSGNATGTAAEADSGSVTIDSGTIAAGTSGTAGTVYIGTNNAPSIIIGNAAKTQSVNIGASFTTDANSTVRIASSTAATRTQTVLIGSTSSASSTTINSGTAGTTFKSSATSNPAFRILNGSDVPLFSVDMANDRVYIGNPASDTTGALLVLDTKSGASDPTGVAGGMYYNAALKKMRCYEGDGYWVDCRPSARSAYFYSNDFLGSLTGVAVGETLKLYSVGSGVIGADPGETGHPGIFKQTGSTSSGHSILANRMNDAIRLGNGDTWRYETMVRTPNLSANGGDSYAYMTGFLDADDSVTSTTDGCYFRYTDSENSGKWQGICRNNGSSNESICDTTITIAASQWYKLEVVVNSAGNSVDFKVDGTSRCQITTNIPTGSTRVTGFGTHFNKTGGSSIRQMQVDYIEVNGQFGTAR